MSENNPFNVTVELPDGIDSRAAFSDTNGNYLPSRQALHGLIVQAVTERNFNFGDQKYEDNLLQKLQEARGLHSFQSLEASGNVSSEKISAILDEMGLEKLPLHSKAEQVMMVTGGAGTGKTSIVDRLSNANPDIYQNAVQINPDHYKDLLAPKTEWAEKHGTYTHFESSTIADEIIETIQGNMDQNLPSPHVMMDVSTPFPNYMNFSKRFENLTVLTGAVSAEEAANRAYSRGYEADGSVKLDSRVTPSFVVFNSAANSSKMMSNIFEHPNLEFTMLSTDNPNPTLVATWDNETRTLAVHDPDKFLDFVERQDINVNAKSPEQLFEGVERSPEKLAQNLQPYTDKGVTIDFMGADDKPAITISPKGAEVHADLQSVRGTGFMADMAESFGNIGKNGGVVAGLAFGTLSGAFTLAAGGDSAQAAEAVYEAAVPYGETQFDLADGDMEAAQRSATIETASNIGAAGGALAGAAIGTAIMPVVGTAVGAVVGGIGAGIASGEATELIYDHADDIADFFDHGDDRLLERLPTVSDENMPPELQHFIEIKKLLVDAQNEREALGADKWFSDDGLDDRRDALDEKIERIEQMYDEAYDEYEDNGALETALASLDNWERAEQVVQSAIEKVKETTFENETSHARSNVDLSLS